MLSFLGIRDILLFKAIDLDFNTGFTAISGETGCGKSLLLKAIGLVLGERGGSDLVRAGMPEGSISAIVQAPFHADLNALLAQYGLPVDDDELLLRRTQYADGRSRAFVNDTPTRMRVMREIGALCVDIHGQHHTHTLLDSSVHLALLDRYGDYDALLQTYRIEWINWRDARNRFAHDQTHAEQRRLEQQQIEQSLADLDTLDPKQDETTTLQQRCELAAAADKMATEFNHIAALIGGENAFEEQLGTALRRLAQAATRYPAWQERITQLTVALDRVLIETQEALEAVKHQCRETDFEPGERDRLEERLFALADAARRHNVSSKELPQLHDSLKTRLQNLHGDLQAHHDNAQNMLAAEQTCHRAAAQLTKARQGAAKRLEKAVNAQFDALHLAGARFTIQCENLAEPGTHGFDRISFQIATNFAANPEPLARLASGGELSRIMLALRTALGQANATPTLIFDEIDAAVGGAAADAVGALLQQLAPHKQILAVTHTAQIAARGDHHFCVQKRFDNAAKLDRHATIAQTYIHNLNADDRREEIARMISGATITVEARAAAARLLPAKLHQRKAS